MIELSVIMPSFLGEYDGCASDRENKFVRAVHSFLENTLEQKELIVVGDNCPITEKLLIENFREQLESRVIKFYQFRSFSIW